MKDTEITKLSSQHSKWRGFVAIYDNPILAEMDIPSKVFFAPLDDRCEVIEIDCQTNIVEGGER